MGLHLITGYAGEEHITSADQGSYNAALMGEGEFVLERGNQFSASIISNNKVRVLDGDMMMQGRHLRLLEDTYEELNFENGTPGHKRYDLIVARYTKDATTGIESASLVVIKGTPSETEPADPEYIHGDIIHDHALVNDMPLYRVPIDGLNIQPLVSLFGIVPTWETLKNETIADIQQKVDKELAKWDAKILDDVGDIDAVNVPGFVAGALALKQTRTDVSQINDNLGNLRFGMDSSGNYGYYKVGADTVTPFKAGGEVISNGYINVELTNNGNANILTFQTVVNQEYTFFISLINPTATVNAASVSISGCTIIETYINTTRSVTLNANTDMIRGHFVKFKATSTTVTINLSHTINGGRTYTGFYALQS